MIISHKYKFIFIKTRKTAGTSIELYLSKFCSKNDILTPIHPPEKGHRPRNYRGIFNPIKEGSLKYYNFPYSPIKNFVKGKKFFNHIPAVYVKSRIPSSMWKNYYVFCFERNPWDKTLSHFRMIKSRVSGEFTLDDYFEKVFFCYNFPQYMDKKQEKVIVDHICKYESINSELQKVFKKLKVPFKGSLQTFAKKSSSGKNYRDVFTDEQAMLIEQKFEKEIELHGYSY